MPLKDKQRPMISRANDILLKAGAIFLFKKNFFFGYKDRDLFKNGYLVQCV